LQEATWDETMSLVAQRAAQILAAHSAEAIGFYNSGQLMLEEYYTLACLAEAGIGTPHLDGSTRLCTATAPWL
jgi:predicted molibdopterin-dependent oxidoreductase YjgC